MVETATRQLDQLKDKASEMASDLGSAVRVLPDVAIGHSPFASRKKRSRVRRVRTPVALIVVAAAVAVFVKLRSRPTVDSPGSYTPSDPVTR
jgi:hypothetical protein